ncbi:TadE/TadG family type IV pilus assembly protein [Plantactinospora siamensis]|uniref:TadE/TadG family type IV pilus assembly protein n=1 Tax=Plantactinospora siamensis TaxID=555372 RepID=A0ABV6NQQ9_9ACTN
MAEPRVRFDESGDRTLGWLNRTRHRTPDQGAAAVEMALVLPLLLLLIFGIIDFGRMLNAQLNATQAAHEGARAAAFGQDPADRVAAIAGTDVQVTVADPCQPGSLPDSAPVTVRVVDRFQFVTPIGALAGITLGGPDNRIAITGRGVMPCQ